MMASRIQNALVSLSFRNQSIHDEYTERRILLNREKPSVKIGRTSKRAPELAPAVDNCWIKSPVISREHAEIRLDFSDKAVFIRDLSSRHGTYVNHDRLYAGDPCAVMASGDTIRFGTDVQRESESYPPPCAMVDIEFNHQVHKDTAVRVGASSSNAFEVPDDSDDSMSGRSSSEDDDRSSIRRSLQTLRDAVHDNRPPKFVGHASDKQDKPRSPERATKSSSSEKTNPVIINDDDSMCHKGPEFGTTTIDLTTDSRLPSTNAHVSKTPERVHSLQEEEEEREAETSYQVQRDNRDPRQKSRFTGHWDDNDASNDGQDQVQDVPLVTADASQQASFPPGGRVPLDELFNDELGGGEDDEFDGDFVDDNSDYGFSSDHSSEYSYGDHVDEGQDFYGECSDHNVDDERFAAEDDECFAAEDDVPSDSQPKTVAYAAPEEDLQQENAEEAHKDSQQSASHVAFPPPRQLTVSNEPRLPSAWEWSLGHHSANSDKSLSLPPVTSPATRSMQGLSSAGYGIDRTVNAVVDVVTRSATDCPSAPWRIRGQELSGTPEENKETPKKELGSGLPKACPAMDEHTHRPVSVFNSAEPAPTVHEPNEASSQLPVVQDAAATLSSFSGDRFLSSPPQDVHPNLRDGPHLDMTSAYQFQQSKIKLLGLLDKQAKDEKLTKKSDEDVADKVEQPLTPDSLKRKANDISEVSAAEQAAWASAADQEPKSSDDQPLNEKPVDSFEEAEAHEPKDHANVATIPAAVEIPPTPLPTSEGIERPHKRLRRMAEAAGYIAIGGAFAFGTLVATAPTFT